MRIYFQILKSLLKKPGPGLKSQQSAVDSLHQEFQIQQEDFPALPRPQSVQNKSKKF